MTRIVGALLKQFGPAGGVTPAMPTLAVSDNADGTGGVATITGADSGATVTVYSQSVDGELGSGSWTSRGSRTGNGTVAVAPAAGYYWWKAVSTIGGLSAISNLVYQNLTDPATAVHYRCLVAARARLQSLELEDLPPASIVVKKIPLDRNLGAAGQLSLPAILVTPRSETMSPHSGVNLQDDVGYGVLVTILDRDNQEPTQSAKLEKYLHWRQQIARALRNQRLPGVAEVINAIVEPEDVLLPEAWTRNLFASSLLVRFISREPRGMS